jgi:hydroxymethylpyrimidine kinase/phosphomethylpyrimidine kinase/thiamine-phosphate diphosphorylase
VTAQGARGVSGVWPVPVEAIAAQAAALPPPAIIKIGMIPSLEHARAVAAICDAAGAVVVLDPVLRASAGGVLGDVAAIRELLPHVDVVTPNLDEARALLGRAESPPYVPHVRRALSPSTVVVKGGHGGGPLAQDCIHHEGRTLWLNIDRIDTPHAHGTGCTFASAIAAALARGFSIIDAIVVAKMFVTNALRNGSAGSVVQGSWPEDEADLPWLTYSATADRPRFPSLDRPLGLYAIVDSAGWVERLAGTKVGAIQLRVKTLSGDALRDEIARAIRSAQVPLFINDHWREAIDLGAFGVHLGQEDLDTADIAALAGAGLRLGVSTHCYEEVARAHALRPSYIAIGPIFETKIKVMRFAPQGIDALRRWRRTLSSYPLVAIGGIDRSTIAEVAATGVDSIAVIRAITQAADPLAAVHELAAAI